MSCLPVSAAVDNNLPVRWNSGGAVWSTNQDAFNTFLNSGDITDRGLSSGISRSGWTADELKAGLAKTYRTRVTRVQTTSVEVSASTPRPAVTRPVM